MRIAYLAAALTAAAAASAQPAAVPPPSGAPRAVSAATDPLVRYLEPAAADPALGRAVALAVSREPAVGEAGALVAEQDAARREARAALYPQADLDLTGQQAISRGFSNDPDNRLEALRPDRRADAVLSAEQLVYDFGATARRVEAARARTRAAREALLSTAEDAAFAAVAAWYDVAYARAALDLAEAQGARVDRILSDTRARVGRGRGVGDLARVEAVRAAALSDLALEGENLAAARLRYERAVGAAPPARPGRAPVPLAAPTPQAASDLARERPDVRAAALQVDAARRDVAALRSDRLPRLTAGVDAAKYNVLEAVEDHDVRGRFTLRQRLFGGGVSEARVDGAAARQAQAEFRRDRLSEDAARDAGISWREVEGADTRAAARRSAYLASRQARDSYAEQFRVARGSLLELLRAESDLHLAARAYARAVAEADIARYRLLGAVGGLVQHFGVQAPR